MFIEVKENWILLGYLEELFHKSPWKHKKQ